MTSENTFITETEASRKGKLWFGATHVTPDPLKGSLIAV